MRIKLLDLFSGIGGFHKGFQQAGFEVDSYFSEIDKHAISVYQHNFKESKYVGAVQHVRGTQLPRIDGITFGSPCQDFSISGNRSGIDGQRSGLIAEAIRIVDECRPRFFVWENVKGMFSTNGGADFWAILQSFANLGGYRLEWQLLNSRWFVPQNRERVYLVGYIGNGSGRQVFPIGQNNQKIDGIQRQYANTIQSQYGKLREGSYIIESKFNQEVKQINESTECGGTQPHQQNRVYDDTGISPALMKGKSDLIVKTNNSRGYEIASEGDTINFENLASETRRGRVGKGIAQTLNSTCEQAVIGAIRGRKYRNEEPKFEERKDDTSNTLTSVTTDNMVKTQSRIRRLTPIECERLQGFPDNWTQYGTNGIISDSQRYKMCGNAVTVDVVQAVAERIKNVI